MDTYRDLSDNIVIVAYRPFSAERSQGLALMAEADIDMVQQDFCSEIFTPEEQRQAVEQAAAFGILTMVQDRRMRDLCRADDRQLREIVDSYRGLPGLGGYTLCDEPGRFNEGAALMRRVHELDPEALPWVDLHPECYERVDDFCRLLPDKEGLVLFFNNYPFPQKGTVPPEEEGVLEWYLFGFMDIFRRAGLKNHIRTGFHAQIVGCDFALPPHRRVGEAELRYHVNTGLAYGFKNINYLTWGTLPPEVIPGFSRGIMDEDGRPTELYEPVCRLNREIHALGRTLVRLEAVEVYHSGPGNYQLYQPIPDGWPVQTRDYVFLSLMKDRQSGREYLMVVNKDFTGPQAVTLTFAGMDRLWEISRRSGEPAPVRDYDGGIYHRVLDPGDAALLMLPEGTAIHRPEETPPSRNLLLHAYATASDSVGNEGWFVDCVNNGKTISQGLSQGWKVVTRSQGPQWVQFDLGEEKTFNRLDLYPAGNGLASGLYFPRSVRLLVSGDRRRWTPVLERDNLRKPKEEAPFFRFPAARGRYVRLYVDGFAKVGPDLVAALAEVQLFNDDGSLPLPERTDYRRPQWEPGKNLALGKPVCDYSSSYEAWNNHLVHLTDGNPQTNWASDLNTGHRTPEEPEYVTIDLLASCPVGRVVLIPYWSSLENKRVADGFPEAFRIQVSEDGRNFDTVYTSGELPLPPAEPVSCGFPPVGARYVRIYADRLAYHPLGIYAMQLCGIEIYAAE